MTCPAQRPTPLSELPTGREGFPQSDHCAGREANNKMTVIIYFIIMLDYYDMKLVYYSLFPPDHFIRKEKAHNHSVYFSNEKIQVVPDDFSPESLNPKSFLQLKTKLNLVSIMILDRTKPLKEEACIIDHVNRSGDNFLKSKTPIDGLPTFPDMSNIYNEISHLNKVVVHTVGPKLFESIEHSSFVVSESVGLISPVWHYVRVKVFARSNYIHKR